jgi:rod shape-determining protein MreC
VLLSLVLITLSFRSSALDGAQGTAADVLRPFEIAANRVSRPFRDAAGWAHGLVDAKSQNAKLRRQIESLRQQVYVDESALQENVYLKGQLNYLGPPTIADFDRVSTTVVNQPPSPSDQSITIAAGSSNHVAAGDVVITPEGLVGTVSRVFAHVARVMLLTDEQSAVTARDLTVPTAIGVVEHGNGATQVLAMDLVSKAKHVGIGDTIVTNGNLGAGLLPSMFPRGIQIGTVTSAGINDINPYRSIQVQPFVDFTSLQSVIVLVPKR